MNSLRLSVSLSLGALLTLAAGCSDQDFVTDVPLRVVKTAPSGDSLDADRAATVSITFSERLAPDSVSSSVKLETLGYPDEPASPTAIDAEVSYSDDPVPTVTVKPKEKLPFSTVFRVSLSSGIRRARDNAPLPVAVSWTFRTVNPPLLRVERIEPGDGSTGIARDATVKVSFSEPVDCASLSGNIQLHEQYDQHPHTSEDADSREVKGSWECPLTDPAAESTLNGGGCEAAPDKCVITFKPEDPSILYRWSSHLALTLEGGTAADKPIASARATPYGGQLSTTTSAAFHVENPAPLAVIASAPGADSGQVARDAAITLQFSEPPDCSAFTSSLVSVKQTWDTHPSFGAKAGTSAPVPGSWSCTAASPAEQLPGTCASTPELCRVVFTPSAGFLYDWSSDLEVSLTGGALVPDSTPTLTSVLESARATTHGGQLPSTYSARFHVVDPPALAIVGSSPSDGATGVNRAPVIQVRFSEPPRCATLSNALLVTATRTLDSHPRFAGMAAQQTLAGTWSCPAPSSASPFACRPGAVDDPCTATFTSNPSELPLPPSSLITVSFAGGQYTEGATLTAPAYVESTRATTRGGELPSNATMQFRIEDPQPLLVSSTWPGAGATEVPVLYSRDLEVNLTQPLSCATVNAATVAAKVTLSDGSVSSYPFTLSCTEGANGFKLSRTDPATPFPYSATFTVSLSGGPFGENAPGAHPLDALESTDATTRGGQLPSDISFSFRTQEPPPMLVKSTFPSGNSINALATAPIDVTFTEKLDCSSVGAGTFLVTETPAQPEDPARTAASEHAQSCTFTCPVDADPAAVRCDHAAFGKSAMVSVSLLGGTSKSGSIRSVDATETGGFLEAPAVAFSYRVEDPAALTVSSTAPNGNPGTNVSANTDVRFTFSRPVRCATALSKLSLIDEATGGAVPGTVTCSNGTNVGPDVNGATVIFTPSAALTVLSTYAATAAAGIVAADATVVDGTARGTLSQDASFRFTIAYEDLQILAATPTGGGALAPIGTEVSLRFNQNISAASLVACTPSAQTNCNFFINRGTVSDQAQAIDFASVGYDSAAFVATFDPSDPVKAPNLQSNTSYTVTVRGGTTGPVGANGVSRIPVDFAWTFSTTDNALVLAMSPSSQATNVEVDEAICVEFVDNVNTASLTANGVDQISLSYTDAFGRSAAVPLDATVPYSISGRSGRSSNYVCLNIVDSPTACYPGLRRLLYGRDYHVTVSTSVQVGSANEQLAAPFSWMFTTRNPPQIAELRKMNGVINEPLTAEERDVPVNSSFTVKFAEVMNPSTLVAANLQIVALDSSVPVGSTIQLDDPVNPRAAQLTLSPRMDFSDAATGKGHYALRILGGVGGVTTLSGNYLAADLQVPFHTSVATALTLSPPESSVTPSVAIPLTANRRLHLASITSTTLFATYLGTPISGIIAQQALQPRAVTYIANPTWVDGKTNAYVIQTTDGVLDIRGNPVPPIVSQAYSTGNTPASNAVRPSTATASAVTPAAGGSTNDGEQSFRFTQPLTQGIRDRMLMTSYYAAAPGQLDGNISLEALGGVGCPAVGTRIALDVLPLPGTSTSQADSVVIKVAGPTYMRAGCQYALKLRQFQTANLYNQAPATSSCGGTNPPTDIISATTCAAGTASPGLVYTGETTAPTLLMLEVQQLDGTFVNVASTAQISGGTQVRATFSEPIDAASVNGATFSLSNGVPGISSVNGNVLTFTPAAHLSAGVTYTVSVGAVADLAGNAYAGSSASFTVESNPALFTAASYDPSVTRDAPYGTMVLSFSEPVDPSTIAVNSANGVGSISPATTTPLFGCAIVDANPTRVLWRPSASLAVGTPVDLTVNPAARIATLTDLAGTSVTSATLSVTP